MGFCACSPTRCSSASATRSGSTPQQELAFEQRTVERPRAQDGPGLGCEPGSSGPLRARWRRLAARRPSRALKRSSYAARARRYELREDRCGGGALRAVLSAGRPNMREAAVRVRGIAGQLAPEPRRRLERPRRLPRRRTRPPRRRARRARPTYSSTSTSWPVDAHLRGGSSAARRPSVSSHSASAWRLAELELLLDAHLAAAVLDRQRRARRACAARAPRCRRRSRGSPAGSRVRRAKAQRRRQPAQQELALDLDPVCHAPHAFHRSDVRDAS